MFGTGEGLPPVQRFGQRLAGLRRVVNEADARPCATKAPDDVETYAGAPPVTMTDLPCSPAAVRRAIVAILTLQARSRLQRTGQPQYQITRHFLQRGDQAVGPSQPPQMRVEDRRDRRREPCPSSSSSSSLPLKRRFGRSSGDMAGNLFRVGQSVVILVAAEDAVTSPLVSALLGVAPMGLSTSSAPAHRLLRPACPRGPSRCRRSPARLPSDRSRWRTRFSLIGSDSVFSSWSELLIRANGDA